MWPFLLHYYPYTSTFEEREHHRNDKYIEYQNIRKARYNSQLIYGINMPVNMCLICLPSFLSCAFVLVHLLKVYGQLIKCLYSTCCTTIPFLSPPVLMHGGRLCVALHPSVCLSRPVIRKNVTRKKVHQKKLTRVKFISQVKGHMCQCQRSHWSTPA